MSKVIHIQLSDYTRPNRTGATLEELEALVEDLRRSGYRVQIWRGDRLDVTGFPGGPADLAWWTDDEIFTSPGDALVRRNGVPAPF